MRFISYLSLSFILFLTSCTNNKDKLANSLPRDTMVKIITEMHIIDAIVISPKVQQNPKKINSEKLYNAILLKHNITNKIFEENLKKLSCDTAQFKTVYDDVIIQLTILQGDIMSLDSTIKK
jgi:hypothetical protein